MIPKSNKSTRVTKRIRVTRVTPIKRYINTQMLLFCKAYIVQEVHTPISINQPIFSFSRASLSEDLRGTLINIVVGTLDTLVTHRY